MFGDDDLKFKTNIDVARRFQDTPRTVKVNVYRNGQHDMNELFSFAYNLEKQKFLEIYKNNDVIMADVVRSEFTDEDLADISHAILRNQGLRIDCTKIGE